MIVINYDDCNSNIDHSKLLSKLHNYGIRGNALELIRGVSPSSCQFLPVIFCQFWQFRRVQLTTTDKN